MLDSLFKTISLKNIEYKFNLIENEDHWSIPLIGMYKGLNIENYPKSADAQFYLGVYYLYVDDKELAIQSFEKCLKIDSEHQPATQQLMHLKKGN